MAPAAEQLKAAVMLFDLALGDRTELPHNGQLILLAHQWRNEAHLCAAYEDAGDRALIDRDEATAAAWARVHDQIQAAGRAATERLLGPVTA